MEKKKDENGLGKLPRKWLRIGVILLAVAVALVAWIASRDGGDNGDSSTTEEVLPAQILSTDGLSDAAADLDQPVYWAGQVDGSELELESLGEGSGVRVRYVPEGSEPGEAPGEVLTVSSYPVADPAQALAEFAERPGAIVREGDDGTEVVSSEERPTSVYFVDPGNTVQVEVYDPSPKRAMDLALSGDVQPVE